MSLGRTLRTVRHLKPVQITTRIRRKLFGAVPRLAPAPPLRRFASAPVAPCERPISLLAGTKVSMLGETRAIESAADWNDRDMPELWRFHLHYHDGLRAEETPAAVKREFVGRWFAENPPVRGDAWDPYTISLRVVNWIFWSFRSGGLAPELAHSLAVQLRTLEQLLEYELLGNHLWVNGKALIFAGLFFEGEEAERWLKLGFEIAEAERREQFLADGGHFELSPTYHQRALEDLLDLVNLAGAAGVALDPEWARTAGRALRWLAVMTRPDGRVPLFNDAAGDSEPTTAALDAYAARLGFPATPPPALGLAVLADTGYCRWSTRDLSLWAKMGRIGPDYLLGHAHADCFTFELFAGGRPAIVDTGVSTYDEGRVRAHERGTAAHNTVAVGEADLAEMWKSFRVGRRPDVTPLEVSERSVAASHDGYARFGVRHRRGFAFDAAGVTIEDHLSGARPGIARLHLAPGIEPIVDGASVRAGPIRIHVENASGLRVERCEIALGFGERVPALCLGFDFSERLVTRIERCASSS